QLPGRRRRRRLRALPRRPVRDARPRFLRAGRQPPAEGCHPRPGDGRAMTTLLVGHPAFARHETPRGHPERIDRIIAVANALSAPAFEGLMRVEAPEADVATIALCHPESYIERLRKLNPHDDEGMVAIDADTSMSPGTFEAALRGAGGAALAVDRVMRGEV